MSDDPYNDGEGELVIGLREVDKSGLTSFVYLAYNAADGSQTTGD